MIQNVDFCQESVDHVVFHSIYIYVYLFIDQQPTNQDYSVCIFCVISEDVCDKHKNAPLWSMLAQLLGMVERRKQEVDHWVLEKKIRDSSCF